MSGGFIDEDGSEGRVSSESEITDAHRGGTLGGGESTKVVRCSDYMYDGDQIRGAVSRTCIGCGVN
jgi:hypothetical protein